MISIEILAIDWLCSAKIYRRLNWVGQVFFSSNNLRFLQSFDWCTCNGVYAKDIIYVSLGDNLGIIHFWLVNLIRRSIITSNLYDLQNKLILWLKWRCIQLICAMALPSTPPLISNRSSSITILSMMPAHIWHVLRAFFFFWWHCARTCPSPMQINMQKRLLNDSGLYHHHSVEHVRWKG